MCTVKCSGDKKMSWSVQKMSWSVHLLSTDKLELSDEDVLINQGISESD
jgi:hypothetical protein